MPEPIAYLLDTGLLILYARGKEAAQEIERQFQFAATAFKPIISVVTVGEVYAFARWRSWGEQKLAQLEKFRSSLIEVDISRPEIIQSYAKITATCFRNGWSLGDNDRWIAATADVTGSTLVTTDKDFDPLAETTLRRIRVDPKTGKIV